ncbi:DUF1329 domain-containing protein [Halopseudomonas pachastrellae]|uniref:DUF1329 domain-containing protein n=1 Tax=Halopseudomonas pachastrellae TaxID=254161 RepID=UPI003D7D52EF
MKIRISLLSALALALASSHLNAAVSAEEAAQLGSSLTPVGAERAGNADGSIPEWTGGLPANAGSVDAAGRPSNPFAQEQPLFVITAANMDQYQELLTDGHKAMLRRYADTFRLPVYPSHRSAALPQSVYDTIARNAVETTLVDSGAGLQNFSIATPFPIPKEAKEVVWNHIGRYRGGSARRQLIQSAPMPNGTYVPVLMQQQFSYRDQLKDFDPANPDNVLYYFMQEIKAPARLSGSIVLVHETLDQVKEPRRAWLYNAGQRRVRRAPQVSYDGPTPATDGQRVADNLDMFNGAMDKYTWELKGKREVLVPYNNFQIDSPELSYDDLIQPGHLNPDALRYERHRVWVVEANVKPDERHIYAKRVFYIDEDTWQISLAEQYDARGQLWRVSEGFMIPLYDRKIPWLAAESITDLLNGRYSVFGLRNEIDTPIEFGFTASSSEYSPTALRNSGVR